MGTSFAGKVAVVTGAGRAIGRATALLLASRGAAVVVNDSGVAPDGSNCSHGPAQEAAAEITAGGGRALANFASVAEWDQSRELVEAALTTFGKIDILVNDAALPDNKPVWQLEPATFASVMGANIGGTYNCTRRVAPHMMERKYGRIVNVISRAGLIGISDAPAYGAAKGAIFGFTNFISRDLAPYAINVNAVNPAATRTRMVVDAIKVPGRSKEHRERDERMLAGMPGARTGSTSGGIPSL